MSKQKDSAQQISSQEKEIITNEQKIYEYDEAYQEKYLKERPWEKDDLHFKSIYKYFSCNENHRSCNTWR